MSYLLIIKTGSTMPDLQNRCGDFEDWMIEALSVDRTFIKTVDVSQGGTLPHYTELSGILITGSHSMVTDRHPWGEAIVSCGSPSTRDLQRLGAYRLRDVCGIPGREGTQDRCAHGRGRIGT